MAIDVRISSSVPGRRSLHLSEDGALLTSIQPFPPFGPEKRTIFRQFLTIDGTPSGNKDMRQAGTLATPFKFFVRADPEKDRYIKAASFLISDAGPTMDKFGAIAALTNGCKFEYETGEGAIIIADELKTNFEFFRMTNFNRPFGIGTTFNELANVVGTSEGLVMVVDFGADYLPPFGIKLDAGSTQKLVFTVQDNIPNTSIDRFDCYLTGFDLRR